MSDIACHLDYFQVNCLHYLSFRYQLKWSDLHTVCLFSFIYIDGKLYRDNISWSNIGDFIESERNIDLILFLKKVASLGPLGLVSSIFNGFEKQKMKNINYYLLGINKHMLLIPN